MYVESNIGKSGEGFESHCQDKFILVYLKMNKTEMNVDSTNMYFE